jgi:hypothetical protein
MEFRSASVPNGLSRRLPSHTHKTFGHRYRRIETKTLSMRSMGRRGIRLTMSPQAGHRSLATLKTWPDEPETGCGLAGRVVRNALLGTMVGMIDLLGRVSMWIHVGPGGNMDRMPDRFCSLAYIDRAIRG